MANTWLRLWHDMPNDPKWRTIAKASKRTISEVMAVYVHLLTNASANATERGRTQCVCSEDIASALDMETEQVDAILSAMEGRVMDQGLLSGWAKRQPEKEDGAAERARLWREKKKQEKEQSEEEERNRTQPNATERPDKDKDKDKDKDNTPKSPRGRIAAIEIKTYIDECKAAGVKTIRTDDPVFEYAAQVGIPDDFLRLAWLEFRDRSMDSGKRYKDWPSAFRKFVRGGYLKLWWLNSENQYELTTAGRQAQQKHARQGQ